MDAFHAAVEFALRPDFDGQGFHVTPGDSGGATAWGIIKKTLATYRKVPVDQVTDQDIRDLTKESAIPIYRKLFWERLKCDQMPPSVGILLFDFSCGNPTAAAVRLQRVARVADDGIIGPITVEAVNRAWGTRGGGILFLSTYHESRMSFYRLLSSYNRFGRGWERRARECYDLARHVQNGG